MCLSYIIPTTFQDQDQLPWQEVVSACPNKDDYKHALVWKFIELVAKEKSLEL